MGRLAGVVKIENGENYRVSCLSPSPPSCLHCRAGQTDKLVMINFLLALSGYPSIRVCLLKYQEYSGKCFMFSPKDWNIFKTSKRWKWNHKVPSSLET